MISKNYNILDEMLDELYQELAEINRRSEERRVGKECL